MLAIANTMGEVFFYRLYRTKLEKERMKVVGGIRNSVFDDGPGDKSIVVLEKQIVAHKKGEVSCLVYSSDSKYLFTTSKGGEVRLYDTETYKLKVSYEDQASISAAKFLNSDLLIYTTPQYLRMINTRKHKVVQKLILDKEVKTADYGFMQPKVLFRKDYCIRRENSTHERGKPSWEIQAFVFDK